MIEKLDAQTLIIMPCCAKKIPGGQAVSNCPDTLSQLVSPKCYSEVLEARAKVFWELKSNPKFLTDIYLKNVALYAGPDLGGNIFTGRYLPAIERYTGTLYAGLGFKPEIEKVVGSQNQPQIMILSALYGPLHPNSRIQDYNLKMDDAPARIWSHSFPPFLEEYVEKNGIMKIRLYVGSATAYYKIAKKAVIGLLAKGLITRAIQYHVVDGSTRNTPFQHGLQLLADLKAMSGTESLASMEIEERILRS